MVSILWTPWGHLKICQSWWSRGVWPSCALPGWRLTAVSSLRVPATSGLQSNGELPSWKPKMSEGPMMSTFGEWNMACWVFQWKLENSLQSICRIALVFRRCDFLRWAETFASTAKERALLGHSLVSYDKKAWRYCIAHAHPISMLARKATILHHALNSIIPCNSTELRSTMLGNWMICKSLTSFEKRKAECCISAVKKH